MPMEATGPSVLFVIGRAVSVGRRAAVVTVWGNAVGVFLQVLAVAAGIGAIVERLRATLLEWNATLPESPIEPDAGALDYPWPAR